MTTQTISRIIDAARIQAPGALEGILRMELFNALKDFFARTDIWHEEVLVPVQPGFAFYLIPSFSRAIVNRLLWLEGPRPSGSATPGYGPPRQGVLETTATAEHPAVLKVLQVPSAQEEWRAHVALTVTDPTDKEGLPTLPGWVVEKYHDYLTSGLISRMCIHPGKPYTSDKSALFHGRRFQEGITLARKDARQGHVYGGQRWTFPQTFASFSQRL